MAQSDLDILNELLDEDFLGEDIDFSSKSDEKVDQKSEEGHRKESGHVENDIKVDKPIKRKLTLVDILSKDSEDPVSHNLEEKSLIHTGDTDSSDDEDNKYFESANYNSFGKSVKKLLKTDSEIISNSTREGKDDWIQPLKTTTPAKKVNDKWIKPSKPCSPTREVTKPVKQLSLPEKTAPKKADVYADPCFGIRLMNPLISSVRLQARMEGKKTVSVSNLKLHMSKKNFAATDWVTAGAITRSIPKTSQNGNQYMIWEISDLKEDLAVVSVFLFGATYTALWKTSVGTVVGLLNPLPSNKNDKTNFSLSLKSPDQVMIWGMAKDYGTCKSFKKSGEKCTAFVNLRLCEYCIYHVQKEYNKYSGRSELQSPTCGDRNFLRNKVLGKSEVFYGGQSFTAVKTPPVRKLNPKDKQRISSLGPVARLPSPPRQYTPAPCNRGMEAFKRLSMSMPGLKIPSTNRTDKERSLLEKLSSPNNSPKVIPSALRNKSQNENPPKLSDPQREKPKTVASRFQKLNQIPNDTETTKHGCNHTASKPKLSNPELNDSQEQLELINGSEKENNRTTPAKTNQVLKEAVSGKHETKTKPKGEQKSSHAGKDNFVPQLSNPELLSPTSEKDSKKLAKQNQTTPKSQKHGLENNTPKSVQKQKDMVIMNTETNNISVPKLSDPESWSPTGATKQVHTNSKKQPETTPKSQKKPLKTSTPKSEQKPTPKSKASLQKTFNSLFDVSSKKKQEPTFQVQESGAETNDNLMKEKSVSTFEQFKTKLETAKEKPPVAQNPTQMSRAKQKALQVIKKQGINPKASQKRQREEDDEKIEMSEIFKELLKKGAEVIRWDLVDKVKQAEEEKYFEKMEYKEQLEEKMLSTFKVECKAVKCIKCKYIWFSASEVCKSEGHPIKVVDAVKRFFKCGNCSNRTVSLHITPLINCNNCQSSNWIRAPMIREKIIKNPNQLSIRGGEQQFMNSVVSNANLNLIVPE